MLSRRDVVGHDNAISDIDSSGAAVKILSKKERRKREKAAKAAAKEAAKNNAKKNPTQGAKK